MPAHCCIRSLPVGVEPVNVSLRTMGLAVIAAPMAAALPVTMLKTPAGTPPARSASSASAKAENGVCAAGLTTMVQPAASAGATCG